MKQSKEIEITKKRHKFIQLKLIKTQSYDQNPESGELKIKDLELRLKKIQHIVYKYHFLNKRILFIETGLNNDISFKSFIKQTNHLLIHEKMWSRGIVNNKHLFSKPRRTKSLSSSKSRSTKSLLSSKSHLTRPLSESKTFKALLKIGRAIDLIVILGKTSIPELIIEAYNNNLPIISITTRLDPHFPKSSFKLLGNFDFLNWNNKRQAFIYSILKSTLTRSEPARKNMIKVTKARKKMLARLKAFEKRREFFKKQREKFTRKKEFKNKKQNYYKKKKTQQHFKKEHTSKEIFEI